MFKLYPNAKKSQYHFSDLIGNVKGGNKSSPDKIDKVAYGYGLKKLVK
ncbi:hypothetical protein HZC07_00105 [Candidatus Micrarchaeota archaeon]|nr:hypothetical protein [Candidatus Micrarchaeota archaeon]